MESNSHLWDVTPQCKWIELNFMTIIPHVR